jgi:hypothetical protein
MTPRVDEQGSILMQLDVEQSDFQKNTQSNSAAKEREARPDSGPLEAPFFTVQTTIRVPPGQVVVVGEMETQAGDQTEWLYVAVTAKTE